VAKIDLAALAATALAQGEEVVEGIRVNWNGMVPPVQVTTGRGLASLDGPPPVLDADQLVEFPSAKQMALVLTGGRILAWSIGLTGKPKQFLGEVPLTAVAEVQIDQVRFGGVIRIVMKSGAIVDLEVMKGDPGEAFTSQLQGLIASA
jgi:hypothetical protein